MPTLLFSLLQEWYLSHEIIYPSPVGLLCKCQSANKDYDSKKGYYFDRFSWLPYPNISGHFACTYQCTGDSGKSEKVVGYILNERHFGFTGGGPENAKNFTCKHQNKEYIPHYRANEITYEQELYYYEVIPADDFDPRGSGIEGLEAWAKKNCKCQNSR